MTNDTNTDKERKFKEAVEGPKAVFAYRMVTGVGTIVITGLVTALFAYVVDVNKNIVDLRISSAVIAGRVDLHTVRLDRLEDKVTRIQVDRRTP